MSAGIVLDEHTAPLVPEGSMVWAIDGDGWPIDGLLVDADEGPPPAGYAVTHVAGRPVAELVAEHDQAKANESALRRVMSRRMSFALTTQQVLDRSKTVTRRHVDRWVDLQPGDRLTAVEKGMGLPKGAKQVVLAEIEVVGVRVELLSQLIREPDYGPAECEAEGFADLSPDEFTLFWATSHGVTGWLSWGLYDSVRCRRIEWRHLDRCHVCPNCGCSFSLPLGMTCSDHRPVEVWA